MHRRFVMIGILAIGMMAWLAACDLTASPEQTPLPTPTRLVLPSTTPTSLPLPEPSPIPTAAPFALTWQRESAKGCERLALGEEERAVYGPCEAPRLAQLNSEELATYLLYVTRLAPFELRREVASGREWLRFVGRGTRAASEAEKAELAAWAAALYERLLRREQGAEMSRLATLHLAGRLGVDAAEIAVVHVEAVDWPNGCLGIALLGRACTQVITPGYRVVLQVGEQRYEYRTDLYGLVLPVPTPEPPTATPTATPSPTEPPRALPTPTPLVITAWLGEYYDNPNLSGAPLLRRNDQLLAMNWGKGAPAPSLPSDNFSARWSRRVWFARGRYRFCVRADDGVRLWVAGSPLINRWEDGLKEECVERVIMEGEHEIVVAYYERGGLAEIALRWERLAEEIPTAEPPIHYWRGAYYDNRSLEGEPRLVRDDREIAFDWGKGAPTASLPRDDFSMRWTRRLFLQEGPYRFFARADDGVRLWVDERPVIDEWHDSAVTTWEGWIRLPAGWHDLRVEYYEHADRAEIQVWWERQESYSGWKGEYYDNRDLLGPPVFVRDDAEISFDWGEGAPSPLMAANDFAVRWSRTVTLDKGNYRFWASVDDGVRFYLDDQLLIDEWHDAPGRYYQRDLALEAGTYTLVVEYYERRSSARIGAGWSFLSALHDDKRIPREP